MSEDTRDHKDSATTAGTAHEATTKPAEPTDDVVATKHQLKVGRRTLAYTATTGRVVLRDEVYEDGKFAGFKAKAEMSVTSYVVDGATAEPTAPGDVRVQRRSRAARACGCTWACSGRAAC